MPACGRADVAPVELPFHHLLSGSYNPDDTVLVTSCPSHRNNTVIHSLCEPSTELLVRADLLRSPLGLSCIRTNERERHCGTSLVMCPCVARRSKTVELSCRVDTQVVLHSRAYATTWHHMIRSTSIRSDHTEYMRSNKSPVLCSTLSHNL
jgi:hypothetical protein